jgi:hypothetical protein
VYKLIPEILRKFEMRLASDRPWKTRNVGFVHQTGVIVRLRARA